MIKCIFICDRCRQEAVTELEREVHGFYSSRTGYQDDLCDSCKELWETVSQCIQDYHLVARVAFVANEDFPLLTLEKL